MTPQRLTDCCAPVHSRRIAFDPQLARSAAVVHTVDTPYDDDTVLSHRQEAKLKQATT
jgi:hypothetical protein